jgi:hypothetical protein
MFKTLHKVNWYSDVVVGNDEPSKGDKIRNCLEETKELVTNAVYLFQRNNQQSKDIRGKVSKHILQQLAVINFKLDGQ